MSNKIAEIAERVASDSLIPSWEKSDSDFDEFWGRFEKWYYEAIDGVFSKVNSKLDTFSLPFDYSVEYDEQFETCRDEMDEDAGNAIGVAVFSNQVDAHVLPVAIDPEKVYLEFTEYVSQSIYKAQAENEMEITLWHEVAHGIMQAFSDQCEYFVMDENGWTDEEEIAEEFGRAKGNLNSSRLGRWIDDNKKNNWMAIYGEEQ
jgi:hypothetical protein